VIYIYIYTHIYIRSTYIDSADGCVCAIEIDHGFTDFVNGFFLLSGARLGMGFINGS